MTGGGAQISSGALAWHVWELSKTVNTFKNKQNHCNGMIHTNLSSDAGVCARTEDSPIPLFFSLTTDIAYLTGPGPDPMLFCAPDPFLSLYVLQPFHLTWKFCIFILKPDSRSSFTTVPSRHEPRSLSLWILVPSTLLKPLVLCSGFLSLTCLYV